MLVQDFKFTFTQIYLIILKRATIYVLKINKKLFLYLISSNQKDLTLSIRNIKLFSLEL